MRTLLQIVQDACRDVGQPRPSVVASATEATSGRMLRLLNKAGQQLIKDHDWSILMNVRSFTPLAAETQVEPPSDYDRITSQSGLWDVNNKRPVVGPIAMEKWLRLTIDNVASIDKYWRLIGSVIHILPAPTATDSFRYSYQSKNWVANASGMPKPNFTADDDYPLIHDELLTLELVWRWKQEIGIDYAEDLANSARLKEVIIAADRGPSILSLSQPNGGSLPENFWPGVITP